jgi:hypothetical protein
VIPIPAAADHSPQLVNAEGVAAVEVAGAPGCGGGHEQSPGFSFLAKDTGLRNLRRHGYAQNQIWTELAAMACKLLTWMQMLALAGKAADGNPNA